MLSTKTATIRLKQPMKRPLDGVPGAYRSKIDRLAVGALCREKSHGCAFHDCESVLAGVSAASSLAVDLATRCNLVLAGFVRGDSLAVYAGAVSPE